MIVFIDTNILLDVLVNRQPFYDASAAVWTLAESGHIAGFISAVSLTNIFYIVRKNNSLAAAWEAVRTLHSVFNLVPVDQRVVDQSLAGGMPDFEDAIQFCSAFRCGAVALITRDQTGFDSGDIAVQSPEQFLAAHFPQ